eukprot:1359076-Rhodomonas_salina.2
MAGADAQWWVDVVGLSRCRFHQKAQSATACDQNGGCFQPSPSLRPVEMLRVALPLLGRVGRAVRRNHKFRKIQNKEILREVKVQAMARTIPSPVLAFSASMIECRDEKGCDAQFRLDDDEIKESGHGGAETRREDGSESERDELEAHPEIRYKKPQSQYILCQECGLLYFISGFIPVREGLVTVSAPMIDGGEQWLRRTRSACPWEAGGRGWEATCGGFRSAAGEERKREPGRSEEEGGDKNEALSGQGR